MGACISKRREKDSREKKMKQGKEVILPDHGVQIEPEPAGKNKKKVIAPTSSDGGTAATTSISVKGAGKGKGVRKKEEALAPAVEGEKPFQMPMRASSCTKEEVDAILIQCGRLSRSSSGKTSNEAAGGGVARRYSGTKRSFDLDDEKRRGGEEGDWERSRPSLRRRTPGRERSLSRERRASRSPARRALDSSVSSGSQADHKFKQPVKMVSVPPREKCIAGNGGDAVVELRMPVVSLALPPSKKANASPRSRSPANPERVVIADVHGQHQASQLIGRNNSPHRRTPMAEIDENCLKKELSSSRAKVEQKDREYEAINLQSRKPEASTVLKSISKVAVAEEDESPEQNKREVGGAPMAAFNELGQTLTRTRSSRRRASRDLDQNPSISYSALLEGFQQSSNVIFSLPACVAKAYSILEAVADLNSFNNGRGDRNHQEYLNPSFLKEQTFEESEIFSKDDLLEPSFHRYVTTRSAAAAIIEEVNVEPQESAGSNSFVGNGQSCPASSSWDPTTADSTDRCWTSRSITAEGRELDEGNPTPPEKSSSLLRGRARRVADVGRAGDNRGGGICSASKKRTSPSKQLQIRPASGGGVGSGGVVSGRMDKGSSARALSTPPVLAASSS